MSKFKDKFMAANPKEEKYVGFPSRPVEPITESQPKLDPHGPGTYLWQSLKLIKLVFRGPCKCRERAVEMNKRGIQWCKDNFETIVGWLREEAENQGIFFIETIARKIIRHAIRKAERKAKA